MQWRCDDQGGRKQASWSRLERRRKDSLMGKERNCKVEMSLEEYVKGGRRLTFDDDGGPKGEEMF